MPENSPPVADEAAAGEGVLVADPQPSTRYSTSPSGAPVLRPYQSDIIARIRDAAARGTRRMLVTLATGAGKMVIVADEFGPPSTAASASCSGRIVGN